MIVPASLAAMRSGLPAWLGWLGVLAGVASLGTVAFFGMFAWMAWIAVAAVLLLEAGFRFRQIPRSDPRLRRGTSLKASAGAAAISPRA